MRCPSCANSESLLWAHNAGVGAHHWENDEERNCVCGPQMICSACDAPLLHKHGFVVLDAACFGYINDTLQ